MAQILQLNQTLQLIVNREIPRIDSRGLIKYVTKVTATTTNKKHTLIKATINSHKHKHKTHNRKSEKRKSSNPKLRMNTTLAKVNATQIMIPETYSPEEHELTEWIEHYEATSSQLKWSEEVTLKNLPQYLSPRHSRNG
jgi:hypothetical protein